MSLRRRVLLGVLAVALVLLAADVVLAGTFRTYLLTRVDEDLVESVTRFAAVGPGPGRGGGQGGRGPAGDGPGGRPPPISDYYLGAAAEDGSLVAGYEPLGGGAPDPDPEQVLSHATPAGERPRPFTVGALGDDGWRMVVLEREGASGMVVVAADLAGVGATYARVVAVLGWATLAVLATSALVAWWVLRQGVRPLTAMAATADAIGRGELSERVADTDDRTEAGRLGQALNAMLARIQEAFAQRAASEARLRRFVADASHELRTPLTSIRGYADLYRQGALADDEALDGAMRRVEGEAARMGELVDDLLLLARLDQGRPLDARPVRLDQLVDDAVRDARAVEPDRPFSCDIHPVTVTGDEARLRQAVGNLLANARVHTPAGTPVRVTVGADDGWATVEVADDGPGMPVEVAARVFERFYRADAARARATGGTGLGLAIVAGVAEAHGGRAAVDATPGDGTRFRLHLPAGGGVLPVRKQS